tara:strand:+ start:139 stop:585 length:447 start_codon:yes stop_codon:yes gene_type:complete
MKTTLYTIIIAFLLNTAFSAGSATDEKTNYGKDYKSAIKLIKKSKYDDAIDKLMALVDIDTTDFTKADVFNEIGFAYRKSQDFDNASKYYDKALKLDPNHLGALEYQGEMYVDLGQKENALANLEKLRNLVGEKDSYFKELNNYISKN